MPRLPEIPQQSRILGVTPGPGPTDNYGERALGEAVGQIASSIQAVKVNEMRQSWQLADATAKSLGELEAFRQSLASNDDYDAHGRLYVDKAKEIEERQRETMPRQLYSVWQQDFRRAARQGELQTAVAAQQLKAERVRTDLGSTLLDLSNLIGVSEEQDNVVRAQALLAIEANAAGGNLSYADREQLVRQFDDNAAEAAIRRDMTADPTIAEARLAAGGYPRISGEKAAMWAERLSRASEAAERRRVLDADRAERAAEHERKLAGDAASKSGDRFLAEGGLTAEWIETNREVLSPEDFRYFYRALRDPPGGEASAPANIPRYADLRERAGRGEDVRTDARDALQKGDIRSSDYDRIVGEVESTRPGWRRVGYDYLKAITGYSEINPTPGGAQLWATVSDEWQQWADAHPNSTPDEARKMYVAIGQSHQLADRAVKVLTLPWPTYGVGSRNSIDLQATAARTLAARDSGEITPDEYQRQAAIWQQWNDLYKDQPQQ